VSNAIECQTSDVAVLLRARTYADGVGESEAGEEVGEFTADTKPTGDQVRGMIQQAATEVRARIGQEPMDEALVAFAEGVVALRAAMTVELSYRPEETNSEDSIYDKLKELYEEGLASLVASLPDTSSTGKGFYSLRTRSDVAGIFSTAELLP
jgi:hypothetical protein